MDTKRKGIGVITVAKRTMKTEGLLSLKETMDMLGMGKQDIERLVRGRKLAAYKIGGAYLRFKKEQVLLLKHELQKNGQENASVHAIRLQNFWQFNSFYIASMFVLLVALAYFLVA